MSTPTPTEVSESTEYGKEAERFASIALAMDFAASAQKESGGCRRGAQHRLAAHYFDKAGFPQKARWHRAMDVATTRG